MSIISLSSITSITAIYNIRSNVSRFAPVICKQPRKIIQYSYLKEIIKLQNQNIHTAFNRKQWRLKFSCSMIGPLLSIICMGSGTRQPTNMDSEVPSSGVSWLTKKVWGGAGGSPGRLARICMCGSVPARTNLCSYWLGLGTAVGSFT